MLIRTQNRARRRGFTLLEVLLVVGILVAIAAIAVPQLLGVQEGANIDQAQIQVGHIKDAAELYRLRTQSFPASLAELEQANDKIPEPLLAGASTLKDPWGQPFNYQFPGTRSTGNSSIQRPDIWSNGPDKRNGTADDIGNWPRN